MKDIGVTKDLQNNTTKVSLEEIKRPDPKLKKQQKYYKYVIDRLMENTFVDVRDQKIWHPYDSHYSRHLIGWATPRFSYFVKDKFGILPNEVELVWSHYKQRIKDENGWVQIKATDPSNRPMNESLSSHRYMRKGDYSEKEINKQKKQDKFIEYVVKDLINDTHMDTAIFRGTRFAAGEKIDAPFFRINGILPQSFLGIVGMEWKARELFNNYIKNKYGAVMEGEMDKIFMFYVEEVKELVKQINPETFTFDDNLDESIEIHPKQQQLFDYVLKEMLDSTEMRPPIPGRLLLIVPEFIKPASPFLYPHYLKSPAFPIPMQKMVKYFKDNYGLVADEVITLWNRYREIMYRKLRKEYPNSFRDDPPVEKMFPHSINEATKYRNKGNEDFKKIDNPKQHKLYNKIADKVVELTVVREYPSEVVGEHQKDIFLTDLLDPAFPGQGMSLPPPVNMPDYDTFHKRMGTVIHDFFPMLEKYWYIDDIFSNIFILTKFVFPKLWNNFYKGEDQPEESTDYGERALDYEEDMGKEKITGGSNTSWDDVTNNESIEPINESVDKEKFLDTILRDMLNQSTIYSSKFDVDTLITPAGIEIFNFHLLVKMITPPPYLTSYMRDTYGLTDEEINHVWLRYKDIILDRIKKRDGENNPFRITESTKPLPDSVFQIIQADLFDMTVKAPRTNKPLCTGGELRDYNQRGSNVMNQTGEYDRPSLMIQIYLPSSEFPYSVEMGRTRSWGQLNDYLIQQYGLTDEECQRVWDEFRTTICKNPQLPTLHESEDVEIVFTPDKKKEKQQKVLDYALEDLTDNTLLDWGNNPNDTYQIIQFPFSIYPKEGSSRLEWIMIDKHYNLDISQFYNQFKSYAKLMYGLTDVELMKGFADWEGNIIKKIRDHSETNPPEYIEESKNVISESNIEKLIDRVFIEIYNAATVEEETIYLNQPYFARRPNENVPNIPFDPFRQQIKLFDYNFVLNDMRRFVTYHINKTLGIVSDHPYGHNDPMVSPIAERLTNAFYKDALDRGFVEKNPNIEKQSWYSGSVIKYHLDESVDWSDKRDNKYHRNGMVNKIVGDFLKMVELTHQSVIFHLTQHMESPQRTHNDPYLTYIYDENGLTQESKDLLYEGLTNGIQWYMEHTGLIDYHPPHGIDTRPSEDKELIKMIADTLHPLIIKAVTDYNEDEGWTMDTLYDGKFLAESTDKQEQYINYVIKHLMDNTKWADASWSQLLLNDYVSMSTYINYGDFEFNFIPHDVQGILKGFGLTKEEGDEIWDFYSRWVLEKVMREGNVNWPNRETHKKRYPHMSQFRLTESKDNTTKFAEKIAKEIIDASTLSGKLLYFYPPVVEEAKDEGPISADVNSDWIQRDNSTGTYHLQDDIRRIGRHYIKKIIGPGIDREDPIFKQVNDIVVDNILQRARNHDWMKEVGGMRDLRDKHGFLRESAQPKYLDKIFNSIVNEIKFEDDKYGAVIIPFISSERYSSTSGELEKDEYKLPKHDRNIRLRTDGLLHNEIKSYLKEIYGVTTEEADKVFDMIRKYIKDELYFRSVVQQILWSVQDDYIQGYGAKVDITPERTMDLKKYDEFKEYLQWWHGIVEPDEEENISDNLSKRIYDEVWNTLKDTITLNESVQPNYLKKITKSILDNIETTDDGYIFSDLQYPEYTDSTHDTSIKLLPYKLKKAGINIHVQPNHILHELFRDKYIDLFGLDWDEIEELYNMVVDEILRVHRLNNLNEIIIGDFGLDHLPSLLIDEMDQEYNLRNYEDYYKLIQDMGYGEDYDPHYDGGKKRYHFEDMGYDDFRPYHEDLLEYLGHHFDFAAA